MVTKTQALRFANSFLKQGEKIEGIDYFYYLDAMNDMYCDSYLANYALDELGFRVMSNGDIVSADKGEQ